MGQYEPDDSRDVTLSGDTTPGEPPKTGPREGETRRKTNKKDDGKAQSGYGNSRDEDGRSDKDMRES